MALEDGKSTIDKGREALLDLLNSYGWLVRIRPQVLAEPLYRLLTPYERRRLIEWRGLRLFVDPFSHLGRNLVLHDEYENEQCELLRQMLPAGGTFIDIGANEGFFSSLAAKAVGPSGLVIAVEPQSRLRDVLEINLSLNGSGNFRIHNAAISDVDRATIAMSLTPISNTGATSAVRRYRWSRKTETVPTRTVDALIAEYKLDKIDLMKIDVEGFELEVVKSAGQALARRQIKTLAVDYHNGILQARGVSVETIHRRIVECGYRAIRGNAAEGGYVVYQAE
jgi:FkbM family methyltransferase